MRTSVETGSNSAPDQFRVYMILPTLAKEQEDIIKVFIAEALENGMQNRSVDGIFNDILEQYVQCWAVIDNDTVVSICITEVVPIADHYELLVLAVSGSGFNEYKHALDSVLTSFARDEGCTAIQSLSRRGMEKAVKDLGYTPTMVLMRKDLSAQTVH